MRRWNRRPRRRCVGRRRRGAHTLRASGVIVSSGGHDFNGCSSRTSRRTDSRRCGKDRRGAEDGLQERENLPEVGSRRAATGLGVSIGEECSDVPRSVKDSDDAKRLRVGTVDDQVFPARPEEHGPCGQILPGVSNERLRTEKRARVENRITDAVCGIEIVFSYVAPQFVDVREGFLREFESVQVGRWRRSLLRR